MEVDKKVIGYTIEDIANWQVDLIKDSTSKTKITLPSLQRGFVWKPHQIESLWDSLLRGYPIGAVLVSKSEEVKELLDGQQRSTSIALGYTNPLDKDSSPEIFNLKKNIPSIWIDLQPLRNSKHGLKFGFRVITRSHPWGYKLEDNKKPITASEREKALRYFREKNNEETLSFTAFSTHQISPWDCHYPVPLFALLTSNANNFTTWKEGLKQFIEKNLNGIRTKYSQDSNVNYSDVTEAHLKQLWEGICKAKNILVPEISVNKEVITNEEETDESSDATLFVRLNSEGTRISGEELIYSLLKATFPEAKELVEQIGLKYIAPSRIVNLFARLTLMEVAQFNTFQKDVNIVAFRKAIKNEEFKTKFKKYIGLGTSTESPAKIVIHQAVSILSLQQKEDKGIPSVFIKETITSNPDLLLVLMVYLVKNNNLNADDKLRIHKDFHAVALFNTDKKKTARILFDSLKNNDFKNWHSGVVSARKSHSKIILPLITPQQFHTFLIKNLLPKLLHLKNRHFSAGEVIKEVIQENDALNFLFFNKENIEMDKNSNEYQNELEIAANYWNNLSLKIYWDKRFLILAQRGYFNEEFKDFMEFDGIEDTNRPWDWDHIYPNSWVYAKRDIASLIRWSVNLNGNYRALSFNENRSQSNHQSPHFRFNEKAKAIKDSFICENDLPHWLCLTNNDNRLKNDNPKVDEFVYAVFKRISNIYENAFNLFGEVNREKIQL